jgi:hypothetical protein
MTSQVELPDLTVIEPRRTRVGTAPRDGAWTKRNILSLGMRYFGLKNLGHRTDH